jgi:hypothetical protein
MKVTMPCEAMTKLINISGKKVKVLTTDPTLSIGVRYDAHVLSVLERNGVEQTTRYTNWKTETTS